jgi:3-oxoisoapionate decarboxylase
MKSVAMKLALQTYSLHLAFGRHSDCTHYPTKLTLEECLGKARAWGFAGVQIDPYHLKTDTIEYGKSLRRLAEQEGLFLELGCEGFASTHLRHQLRFAEALGARFIRVFDVVKPRPKDQEHIQRHLNFISQEVESLIPELEKMEITLGWENHADYTTSEQLLVLQRLNHPRFRACLDIGNSMLFLEPPLATVERLAPFAGGVHLKDYAVTGTTFGLKFYGTALGAGMIPLEGVLEIIKRETMLPHLVYEQSIEPVSDNPAQAIQKEEDFLVQSLAFARTHLGLEI